jgi:hypothetical protein
MKYFSNFLTRFFLITLTTTFSFLNSSLAASPQWAMEGSHRTLRLGNQNIFLDMEKKLVRIDQGPHQNLQSCEQAEIDRLLQEIN